MSHTRESNLKKQLVLLVQEKEVIEACLLGDGTLSKAGKEYRLRVEHKSEDKTYVAWKHQLLKRLCISGIQKVTAHESVRFGTVGHPEMTLMRQRWYRPYKQVPLDLDLSPLMMAIWFMDDGTKHRDTVDISVHSFSKNCLSHLREKLSSYQIETTVNSDAKGSRLYVLKKSYSRFKELIAPYMIKCMMRKMP